MAESSSYQYQDEFSDDDTAPPVNWSKKDKKEFYTTRENYKWALRSRSIDPNDPTYLHRQTMINLLDSILDRKVQSTDIKPGMTDLGNPKVKLEYDYINKKWPKPINTTLMPVEEAAKEHIGTPALEVDSETSSDEDNEPIYIDCTADDPEAIPVDELPKYHYGLENSPSRQNNSDSEEISISSDDEVTVDPIYSSVTNLASALVERAKATGDQSQREADRSVALTLNRWASELRKQTSSEEREEAINMLYSVLCQHRNTIQIKLERTDDEGVQPSPSDSEEAQHNNEAPIVCSNEANEPPVPPPYDQEKADELLAQSQEDTNPEFQRIPTPDPVVGRPLPPPPMMKRKPRTRWTRRRYTKRQTKAVTVADRIKRGKVHDYYFNEWLQYRAQYPLHMLNRTQFCEQRGIDRSVIEKRERTYETRLENARIKQKQDK